MQSVRKMQKDDVQMVAAIEKAVFANPWTEQGFLDMMGQAHISAWVIESDGKIRGFGIFSFLFEEGELLNIATAPDYRQQHAGSKLLEAGLREADEKGVTCILLEVRESNDTAIRFYEAFNFEKIGMRRDFYEKPREHATVMKKILQR